MFNIHVYTVEIYDTTEYDNQILELQVFFKYSEALNYLLSLLKRKVSYRDNYINFQINDWCNNSCLISNKLNAFGNDLYNYYKKDGVLVD